MKKYIFILFISGLCCEQQVHAQDLKSNLVFDMQVELGPPQVVGPVLKGTRLISPFRNGIAKGGIISGKVLEGSGDWGLIIDSMTFKVDSRVTIETDDGSLIYVTSSGYSHSSAKIAAMIGAGKGGELSPTDYYFRTSVSFESSSAKYAWLNHTVGIGVGSFPAAGKVAYRIYAVE